MIWKIKLTVDMLMTAALPVLMAYSLVGETLHEIIGLAMFVLFITHQILNRRWYAGLFKCSYTPVRSAMTVCNCLIFTCMLGLMYSGIVISKHVFVFLGIESGMSLARNIHMLCAYWGFLLMSVHLGFHGNMIIGRLKDQMHLKIMICTIIWLISAYGIYAFIKRKISDYLFLKIGFLFFDTSESTAIFLIDYLAVMILFAACGYLLIRILQRRKTARREDL